MGNTTSSLNLFATCLPQHQPAVDQQKSSFNPTLVDDDQPKSDDWDSDFSDHFDEEKKETKTESKVAVKSNEHSVIQPAEKAPMRLEKKDKEATSLKLSKEKEPTNPNPESSDKVLNEPIQPTSPKISPATTSPKQPTQQSKQATQETNNANPPQSQDVDFFFRYDS